MGVRSSSPTIRLEVIGPASLFKRSYDEKSLKTLDRHVVIWFTVESSKPENVQRQTTLRSLVNSVLIYEKSIVAEQNIKCRKYQKLFVIIDGDAGLPLILSTYSRPQIAAIYVYCKNVQRQRLLLEPIKKVQFITDDFDSLIKHLKKDLKSYEKTATMSFVTKQGISPVLSQIDHYYLIQYWPNFQDTNLSTEAKSLLIDTYMKHYKDDKNITSILNDFNSTIRPDTAINWYTQPLIGRLLDAACQTHNFSFLNKFRYFISCIHIQLQHEHSLFIQNRIQKPIFYLYSGRLMTTVGLKSLRIYLGKVIFFAGFIMANSDKNKAIQSVHRCQPSDNEIRVLFRIDIDARIKNTKPFADITHLTDEHHEKDILIMFGASFRLMNVIINPHDELPMCVLELCAEETDFLPPSPREQRWYSLMESYG